MSSSPRRLPVFQPDPFTDREWPEEELLQVGELAKATGKTVRAVHLYESLELIRPQNRSKGKYRLFSPDTVLRVRWIAKLQSLGLSLTEIQELARQREASGSALFAAHHLQVLYAAKLRETQKKLAELHVLERELQASLAYLASCDTQCVPELPVESCSVCERHNEPSPALIAGASLH